LPTYPVVSNVADVPSSLETDQSTRQLEPPGFLALNYGRRKPLSVLLDHLAYGGILGGFYRLEPRRRAAARRLSDQAKRPLFA
jgi:hypothetical protein